MISTAGLELVNFLNPDLSWKTVTKGNRSATRCTRKPGGRKLTVAVDLADKSGNKRAEDTAVSEFEKLGVAVLGRCFSDEIEHVPIKKRKFNLRYSTPPQPRTPSHTEVVQHASRQGACPNSNGRRLLMAASSEPIISHSVVDGKISDSVKGKLGYKEDFSGIEILAAAACDNSFEADVGHPEENPSVEGSVQENDSEMLVEEAVAPVETANYLSRDTDGIEDSSVQDTNTAFVRNSFSKKDNKTVERLRLHWGLNVVMDTWEDRKDIVSAGSQTRAVEGTFVVGREEHHILKGYETERETENAKHNNMVDAEVSPEVHEKTCISLDLRGLANESDREDNQLEACAVLDRNHRECGADLKPKDSTQLVSLYAHIDSVACPNKMASNSSFRSYLEEKAECCASSVKEAEIVSAEIVQVEKYDAAASPHIPALDSVTCEADSNTLNENGEDYGRASCSQNDVNAHQDMISVDICELPDPVKVETASKAEEVGVDHPSPKCEDVATSSESSKEVQIVASEEAKGETDSSLHIGSEKLPHVSSGIVTATLDSGFTNEECGGNGPSNSSRKINFKESNDDICVSEKSHEDKVDTVPMENSMELQDGYDSQFEDGELREADAHNYEGADIEQVDYESECEGGRLCIHESEVIDNKRKFESWSSIGSGEVTEKSEQGAVGDAFGDYLMSSEARISESTHRNTIKKNTADCEDESSCKGFTSRMIGARASRREFSRAQGSLSSDVLQRCGSDNFDYLCPRSERESDPNSRFMGKDRFSLHIHHRSPGGSHTVNTHQSLTYHGPCGSGGPRPRSVVESHGFVMASDGKMLETTGDEGFDSRVRRQYMSSSSNSVYWPFNRRRLGYRDDIYTRMAPVRDNISSDRSRFRRYPQGISRGFREDYCRPMHNYHTDDHMPQRMSRRERSISPLGERPHYVQPYKKPRSRSRSRSPSAWFSMREQYEGSRQRSSSSDFRSTRINRVRVPFKKRFEVEYEEGFMSPPRNRILPQRNPPRFDDRTSGLDNFRDTKSLLRMFRQGQMFDSSHPFRPMKPSRRFPDMGGDHDDRRNTGNRCEVIRRVRYYDNDDDGVVRRLRYNNNTDMGNRCEVIRRVRYYDNDDDGVVQRLRYNNNTDDSFVANES